jgi:hypothetical protein
VDDAEARRIAERDEVHALIVEAASGARRLTGDELSRVLRWVADAGFDSTARETARGLLAGMAWRGRVLAGTDRLPPAERHFIRHVVQVQEWPVGTTLDDYVQSIRDIVLDDASGVFTSIYRGAPQLGVIRRAGSLRGPDGTDWVLVEYRLATGHWVTAYQPSLGLRELAMPQRGGLRWLRRARLRAR